MKDLLHKLVDKLDADDLMYLALLFIVGAVLIAAALSESP